MTRKYLKKIKIHEKNYEHLKQKLKNHSILQTQDDHYLKTDKEDFLLLWKEFFELFDSLQNDIKKLKIRKYFLAYNYNNYVLKKYYLVFYFNIIMEIEAIFSEHDTFIRNLLADNYEKDFWYYSKYIYKPRCVAVINTPNIFLKAFEDKLSKDVNKLLEPWVIEVHNDIRLTADYNNLFFYFRYRYDKVMYYIIKKVWWVIAVTKFSRREKWYITQENLDVYLKVAKPWDIFLTRGNWNASNIWIPGFWKHMSMYIGTGKYLKKHHSHKHTSELKDNVQYIIEATGEGIKIVELDHIITKNDYLGISRTTFKKEKIERAIQNSFQYIWRNYDFIFNFYSDKNMVCSELIMKSYAKEYETDEGIEISLEHVWSWLVFPPNNFINLVFSESQKKHPTVKPFFFIDSKEKTGENFLATYEDLLESRKRARFSFGLE